MGNYQGWQSVVGDKAEVCFCLFYDCPESELEKRLLKRGETSGRDDDNIEAVRKRFKTFQEESMPIVSLYKEQGLLREISSVASVDEVWAQTKALFEAM
mmetsp:Transcript_19573/g.46489  ORF Transcript_19573/g.46489 Transcript_19573/m.46489 type:complete len:99 (+) Transcript_19573:319-615(+)